MTATLAVGGPLATTEQVEWRDYLAWLAAQPPADHPDDLFVAYLNHMAAAGLSPQHIVAVMDALGDRLVKDTNAWRAIFNNVYRSPTPRYSTRPNVFLAELVSGLPPGAALDIAMGQGRNALFLAGAGWRVTGFDIADIGLAVARATACDMALDLSAVCCTQQVFCYGVDSWNLIVATYCPLALDDMNVVTGITRSLRPGGLLLVEGFSRTRLSGPPRIGAEFDLATLAAAFSDLTVVYAEEAYATADWCEGDARVVRFLAQRREDVDL